jgi:hypothetical protein
MDAPEWMQWGPTSMRTQLDSNGGLPVCELNWISAILSCIVSALLQRSVRVRSLPRYFPQVVDKRLPVRWNASCASKFEAYRQTGEPSRKRFFHGLVLGVDYTGST